MPMSCSAPEMSVLSSRLLNIRSQSSPITSASPFLQMRTNQICRFVVLT
jgi:hypothetical protein